MGKEKPKIMPKKSLKERISFKYKAEKSNLVRKLRKFGKNKDFIATKEIIYEIGVSGLLLNLAAILFGYPISITAILALGSLYWMLENKLIDLLTRVISSFKPIVSYK